MLIITVLFLRFAVVFTFSFRRSPTHACTRDHCANSERFDGIQPSLQLQDSFLYAKHDRISSEPESLQ